MSFLIAGHLSPPLPPNPSHLHLELPGLPAFTPALHSSPQSGHPTRRARSYHSPTKKLSVASCWQTLTPASKTVHELAPAPLSSPMSYYLSWAAFCPQTCHSISHFCWVSPRSRAWDKEWAWIVSLQGDDPRKHWVQGGEVRQGREGGQCRVPN